MSDLVDNPEDMFSRDVAHLNHIMQIKTTGSVIWIIVDDFVRTEQITYQLKNANMSLSKYSIKCKMNVYNEIL